MEYNTSGGAMPLLFLIIGISALVALGFRRGRKKNGRILLSAFQDLLEVFQPDDQTFTNIGGYVGHHANFHFTEKGPIYEIDATMTLLPRQAPLYIPISKLLLRSDRLFLTFYMRYPPKGEGHLIEKSYDGFRGHEITHRENLHREEVSWGPLVFNLYYQQKAMLDNFRELIRLCPNVDGIRHVAVVPDKRKGFLFMIPMEGRVALSVSPVYQWMRSVFDEKLQGINLP